MDDDRIRWVPSSEQPNELISLRQARQLLIERVSGSALVASVGDSPTAIGCRGEFVNMVYGGSILKAELAERAELAKMDATQEFACHWIGEQLGSAESKFYRVEKRNPSAPIRGPLVIEAALPEDWQSSERDRRFLQKLILERNEDPSGKWWYALDKATFLALLEIGVATDESEHAIRGAPEALPFATLPIDNVKDSPESGELKSPKAFVSDFFAEERREGREPTIRAAEKAWTAGRRGQRDEVRAAARKELEKGGKRVERGRPKKSPK